MALNYIAKRFTAVYLMLVLASNGASAAVPKKFSIEPQPLAGALIDFARQSGMQILFQVQDLPSLSVSGFSGDYDRETLLMELLRGSGFTYSLGPQGVILIVPAPTVVPGVAESPEYVLPALSYRDDRIEEIEVVGIRSSLQRSLVRKRDASRVMDVITAEGIGKFPDKNVADSLQRVPGISVDRIWGEGRDINIRGTDKDVNRTFMNGQNVASSYWWANDNPSRGFNYSILASELVSALEVSKSPEADIDEGSIGGSVNIRTRRPFELDNNTFQASIESIYSELPDQWDPQAAILTSWKNDEQSFGILASVNYQKRTVRRDGLEAFPDNNLYTVETENGETFDNVHVPWGMGSAIFQQRRERITGNVTVQWAPTDAWDLVFNSVHSSMDMDNQNQNYLSLPGEFKFSHDSSAIVSSEKFIESSDGYRTLVGGTIGSNDTAGAALDAIFRESYIETQVYDFDGNYQQDTWNLHWQLGMTEAEGGSDHDRLYRFVGNTREHYSLTSRKVEFNFLDLEPELASSLDRLSSDTHDWVRRMRDSEQYAQLDLDWEVDIGWFKRFKVGAKRREYSVENRREIGEINTSHGLWPGVEKIGLEQVSSSLTPKLHSKTAAAGSLVRYAWVDEDLVTQIIEPYFSEGLMRYQEDRGAFYHIDEDISALYWMGDFESGDLTGNLGLRAVRTQQQSSAWKGDEFVSVERHYDDWLPSLNLRYEYTDSLLFRAAAARVMARPTFPNLTPSIIIDATDGTASGGNPDLDAFHANQWEIGAEWYFNSGGLLAATWFYKDMSTFVFSESELETMAGQSVLVSRPQNGSGADIRGLELQWQQDLGYGFGSLANYTYTDAEVPSDPSLISLNLPGNSRDQINASFYYENERVSARLSWNYRSESFGGFDTGSQDVTEAYDQWDASFHWQLSEVLSASVEAVNLMNEVVYYRTANGIPQGIYENGRRLSLGLRLSL